MLSARSLLAIFAAFLTSPLGQVVSMGGPALTGRLDPGVHTHQRWQLELRANTADSPLPKGRRWIGTIEIPPLVFLREGGHAEVVLAETTEGQRLFADPDRDGVVAPSEEVPPLPRALGSGWVITFPFAGERPGKWLLLATFRETARGGPPTLLLDPSPYLTGHVAVSGREILVRMPFDLNTLNAEPRDGYLGIDADGNGSIADDTFSAEATYAMNEEVVLRVLDRYVSIAGADVNSGTIRLAEHPASDYEKMELTVGAVAPDFSFRTLDGKAQRLSDFTGEYVLLFVWDTGCYFAGEEVGSVRQAVETFGTTGFVALGFSDDEDMDKARVFIREHQMTWPQVVGPEAAAFIHRRIRVVGLPTVVLLDGERRVVSRNYEGELPIRGAALSATLGRLIGR